MTISAIIAGLGNPGASYADTRHNIGFRVLDALAARAGAAFTSDTRHRGSTVKTTIAGHTVWLVKPLTFMNESGTCIGPFLAFHKIPPARLIVVHDDITLAPGFSKLSTDGSDGGHNGIASILRHLPGTFARYRVGIGPKHWREQDLADHVLGKFTPDEQAVQNGKLENHMLNIEYWIVHGTAKAQNLINRKTNTKPTTSQSTSPTNNECSNNQNP